jgi:hypothetical protein
VVLVGTETVTVPLPVPAAPDVIVIHDALLVAVHAHPDVVVMETVAVPPPATKPSDVGVTVARQLPSWVIVTVCPATVSVPVRGAPLMFAEMAYVTVPLPEPFAPIVTAIQDALLEAVHVQPVVVVTVTLPVADPLQTLCVTGTTV